MALPEIYAKKNEIIRCEGEKKHPIARIKLDAIFYGQPIDHTNFLNFCFKQKQPTLGQRLEECGCEVCGARWVSGATATVFHFEDGWRAEEKLKEAVEGRVNDLPPGEEAGDPGADAGEET